MSDLEIKKTYGLFANPLNKKLISELERKGEDVLIFPPLKTEKLELTETAANHLHNLAGFDWIIFSDVFAAVYFIEHLSEREIDFFELDNLTVCALGEAVADRLRFVQVHADVIPAKIDDATVFSAISNYAGLGLGDLRFLVAGEKSSAPHFTELLKAEKAIVEELPVYKADLPDAAANIKLKTLLNGGAVDEFIFSSPEDLLGLRFLGSGADLSKLLNEIQVSAASEIVFQSLQENGLRPLYFHYK
jgi:uroporphyrinogen-III synthase